MITDIALGLVFGLLGAVVDLLPVWSPPEEIANSAGNLGSQAGAMNAYVPVTVVGICLAAVVAYALVLTVLRLVLFVYQNFPFKAT